MNGDRSRHVRVLAIDPTTRGFGFAVLEGPDRLIEWGTKQVRGAKNAETLVQLAALVGRYRPDVLVLEDVTAKGSRRRARVRDLAGDIVRTALRLHVRTKRIPWRRVRRIFAETGPVTKTWIAAAIASRFSALAPSLPPRRKPWMSEDARMCIFDAVALAVAYYARGRKREI